VNEFIPVSRPSLSKLERDRMIQAFDSSWIGSSGEFLYEFETRFAALCGAKHVLAVSNGTVALHLALAALGIAPGDEVIVPSLTYVATANAVRYVGAEPVFADVSAVDWCLDPESVKRCMGPRTRAVIAVHLYGHPADMRTLRVLCDDAGIPLIEDAAEAPLAVRDGQVAGSVGDVATFSFYGNKVIACGEGGAVSTSNPQLANRMELLRGQGMDPQRRYWFPVIGYNFRLTNIAAAILCGQIDRIDALIGRRREIYAEYDATLTSVEGVELQPTVPGVTVTPWMYCVLFADQAVRDHVAAALLRGQVDSRPFFIPLHRMPSHAGSRTDGPLAVTLDISSRGLNLPTYPDMTPTDIERVLSCLARSLH
jgi:perosamine synthetase